MLSSQYFNQYKKALKCDLEKVFLNLKIAKDLDFEYLLEASAVYSSNIEGNTMDLNSFMNSKNLKVKQREFKEIIDLKKAYDFARENDLNEKNFLKAHAILAKNFLIKNKQGKYRQEKIGVFISTGLIYLAVEPEKVKQEMNVLFIEIKKILKEKLNIEEIFYYASFIHLKIAQIHPFFDGNGRIARLAEKWFLANKLDKNVWLVQSEKFYKENLKEYYQNINLGPNYYELNESRSVNFLLMLTKTL